MFGTENFVCSTILDTKKILVQTLGAKKCWAQKSFGLKKFGQKKFGFEKFWVLSGVPYTFPDKTCPYLTRPVLT